MSKERPWDILKNTDKEIFDLIQEEMGRQKHGLELIASENFASPAVIASMGNILANKYAGRILNTISKFFFMFK